MATFAKVQIYCRAEKACFRDVWGSSKPEIIVNIDEISSLEQKTDWGFHENCGKYPYRKLYMNNGDVFLACLDSANNLEKTLLKAKAETPKT